MSTEGGLQNGDSPLGSLKNQPDKGCPPRIHTPVSGGLWKNLGRQLQPGGVGGSGHLPVAGGPGHGLGHRGHLLPVPGGCTGHGQRRAVGGVWGVGEKMVKRGALRGSLLRVACSGFYVHLKSVFPLIRF